MVVQKFLDSFSFKISALKSLSNIFIDQFNKNFYSQVCKRYKYFVNRITMNYSTPGDGKEVKDKVLLRNLKSILCKNNEEYIKSHPEIRAIIRVILHEACKQEPSNFYTFVSKIFHMDNIPELLVKINDELNLIKKHADKKSDSDKDVEELFQPGSPLGSKCSGLSVTSAKVEALLKFAMIEKDDAIVCVSKS